MHTVAVIIGSLRTGSINARLAHALKKLAGGKLDFHFVGIGELPLYNDDLWLEPPSAVPQFKDAVAACDAVLFVSPEYNRGVPGVLKNAFDWGSRPPRQGVWSGKPAGLVGASPGAISTAVAQAQWRSILTSQGMKLMGAPEIYLHWRDGLIDDDYMVTDEGTTKVLGRWIDAFAAWVAQHA